MEFEEINKNLEQIIGKLETGEVSLSKGIELYEQAGKLIKQAEDKLKDAKLKIENVDIEVE